MIISVGFARRASAPVYIIFDSGCLLPDANRSLFAREGRPRGISAKYRDAGPCEVGLFASKTHLKSFPVYFITSLSDFIIAH